MRGSEEHKHILKVNANEWYETVWKGLPPDAPDKRDVIEYTHEILYADTDSVMVKCDLPRGTEEGRIVPMTLGRKKYVIGKPTKLVFHYDGQSVRIGSKGDHGCTFSITFWSLDECASAAKIKMYKNDLNREINLTKLLIDAKLVMDDQLTLNPCISGLDIIGTILQYTLITK